MAARSALADPELERYRALMPRHRRRDRRALRARARTSRSTRSPAAPPGRCYERGIEPLVLLVAGGERLPLHRHPAADRPRRWRRARCSSSAAGGTASSLASRACARSPRCRRRARALRRPARGRGRRARRDAARRPDRRRRRRGGRRLPAPWLRARTSGTGHHQGGPTGYTTRDYLADPATDHVAVERQAFAWNPSGGGFKVEDTVVTTAGGVEVLSPDPDWPAIAVAGRQRPDVLA